VKKRPGLHEGKKSGLPLSRRLPDNDKGGSLKGLVQAGGEETFSKEEPIRLVVSGEDAWNRFLEEPIHSKDKLRRGGLKGPSAINTEGKGTKKGATTTCQEENYHVNGKEDE